jgi:hypothetical protein
MKKSIRSTGDKAQNVSRKEDESITGYPLYPASEDVFNRNKIEENVNPEDISKLKSPDEEEIPEIQNENDGNHFMSANDLDIPGSELDDEMEKNGTEDEENNYYSIGGDDHSNLDEDKDDL